MAVITFGIGFESKNVAMIRWKYILKAAWYGTQFTFTENPIASHHIASHDILYNIHKIVQVTKETER